VFIVKLLSQHVSSIIMPIFKRTRLCITAYGVLHCNPTFTMHGHKSIKVCTWSIIYVYTRESSWNRVFKTAKRSHFFSRHYILRVQLRTLVCLVTWM